VEPVYLMQHKWQGVSVHPVKICALATDNDSELFCCWFYLDGLTAVCVMPKCAGVRAKRSSQKVRFYRHNM